MANKKREKIVVVVGPTSSGKSDLAVLIAKKFNGEVISADSRQVYKGLDIGTGKITKREMKGVKHHLLDVVSPKKVFTVVDFKEKAEKAIENIAKGGKIPIVAGGTGFYIQALIDDINFPPVKANKTLRDALRKKSIKELHEELSKLDPDRAENIDSKNKVRLIRAIEIAKSVGRVPKISKNNNYDVLIIGIEVDPKKLRERIKARLKKRIKVGMVKEARNLHERGLTYKRMEELGLEYRYLALFLKGEISKEEMFDRLETKIWQYSKRQNTWFRKDKRIIWLSLSKTREIEKVVEKFLRIDK
ncbi:MAG: tRNA (adenosine(37)-N6)-dimethylallyltransferase MiaA [Candidatus Pacebacteria bacterium]|jgi:tRNA dimethylallyltransferase|nr:tRNA (adenosine(37)-N6)-dimethylallyltransferase MiaA [Candidatus Paceibacterota bacterium]MDP6659806.1 tRNA (adenosine(37)-N6)-dimethylallyltransferase MiaA [Candidatus Paceibacterota bacterium]